MKFPALFAALALSMSTSSAFVLFKEGKPLARIYLSEDSPVLKNAVADLNYHFETMGGVPLEVVEAGTPADIKGSAIVLGALAREAGAEVPPSRFRNAVRILATGDRLLIAGETPEATASAIYTFLSQIGCDWVMPGKIGEIIPSQRTLEVPEMDLSEIPSFYGRNLWYRGGKDLNTPRDIADFTLWRARQRMDPPGGTPDLGAGHVWDTLIKRHPAAFAQDATMLALVRNQDGQLVRSGPQIESTHPRIVDLFVKDIEDRFAKNQWPKDKAAAFGIGPADGLDFSLSSESALAGSGRIDPLTGSPDITDLCVLLGNQILERLEKDYPNVSLGYYAYSVHGDFPMRHQPHPRLNQIFAPVSFSRYHSPLATNSKTWPYYVGVVDQWSELAKRQGNQLSYRGYNWNLAENMAPYTKLRIFGKEIPWYREKGFIAVNIEATKAWAVNGPADYLLARLMWNADQDWRRVLNEYCRKSFGKGAPEMEAYFLDLARRQHDAGQEAGSFHALHLIFDPEFVERNTARILRAVAAAEGKDQKERTGYFLFPLEQLGIYLEMQNAFTHFDFPTAEKRYRELLAAWEKAYSVNTQIVAREVPKYLERFFGKFLSEGRTYSTAPYRIVQPLPDELITQWDSNGLGERLGYQSPHLNDSRFLKTRTWSVTWDAQGLAGLRTGAIWYRFPFETPENLGNDSLGLFLGGVEDQVDVWLNGQSVGASPARFCTPFLFDLTKFLEPEGKNILVLKVRRVGAVNEIGLGGMIRPAFLFAGPTAPSPPQAPAPGQRVLPGGELAPAP